MGEGNGVDRRGRERNKTAAMNIHNGGGLLGRRRKKFSLLLALVCLSWSAWTVEQEKDDTGDAVLLSRAAVQQVTADHYEIPKNFFEPSPQNLSRTVAAGPGRQTEGPCSLLARQG